LIWISLNVVDGSPDGLITVSSLVAFRIYILSNYMGRFLLAEAQELNKNFTSTSSHSTLPCG
jgi:hypothetical protein